MFNSIQICCEYYLDGYLDIYVYLLTTNSQNFFYKHKQICQCEQYKLIRYKTRITKCNP